MSVYKGDKLVAGRSIDTYLVRNPAWEQAVEISAANLVAGYTAPSDGIVVGAVHNTSLTDYFATINGVNRILIISRPTINNYTIARPISISTPLNRGDTLGCTAPNAADIIISPSLVFVPFEDSAVEVETPELIRNLHDPDWSQAESITVDQLVAGYTVPKRGIIVGSIIPNTYDVTGSPIIKINGIVVSYARGSSNEITHGSVQCSVCANDIAKLEGISAENCDAHISFVPYKAQ